MGRLEDREVNLLSQSHESATRDSQREKNGESKGEDANQDRYETS